MIPLGGTPKDLNVKGPKRILIVDDNRVVLKVTAAKLQDYGYEVHTAEDGGGAISKLREVKPDMLLLDLNFPPDIAHGGGVPWDGLLLLSWLRRMTEAEHLQVIAITGGDLPDYKERCLEAGVLDIFLKPLDIEALVAMIRRALREAPRVQDPAPAPARSRARNGPAPELATSNSKSSATQAQRTESLPRKRILFVDDESDWRYMGELYLKECGYDVITTADGVSALAQASMVKPQMIVLDLNLAGQGGTTLLKMLVEANPGVPILIYTGMELADTEVSDLLKAGAFECLRKGSMEELLSAIARAIGESPEGSGVVSKGLSHARRGDLPPTESRQEVPGESQQASAESGEETETVSNTRNRMAPQQQSMSVLVIAGEGELRNSLRSFLEPHACAVSCVADGAEALERIQKTPIDLIVLDMAVSGMPLDEFYRALEGVKPELCQRIIFITNDDVHPTLDGFVRRVRGVTLWQPFPLEELLEAAQKVRDRASGSRSGEVSEAAVRALQS